jgi:hypothetical protein
MIDNECGISLCVPVRDDEGPVQTYSSIREMLDIDRLVIPWLAQINYVRSMLHPTVLDPADSVTLSTSHFVWHHKSIVVTNEIFGRISWPG